MTLGVEENARTHDLESSEVTNAPVALALAPAPVAHQRFVGRYPKLAAAWDLIHEAASNGPLGEKEMRLIKLAIAVGALKEGAVRSAARKARAVGVDEEAISQVVALAASTIGFPSSVAVSSWIGDPAG